MLASTIKITFTENLPIGAQLGFNVNNDGGQFGVPTATYQVFNWVNFRSTNNQVTKGEDTLVPGERPAINFMQAFMLDNPGMFEVTRVLNAITIKAPNINSITEFSVGGIFAPYVNHPSLEFEINNGTAASFSLVDLSFSEAMSEPCKNVRVNIEATGMMLKMLSPISEDLTHPSTTTDFDWIRGQYILVSVQSIDGQVAARNIQLPVALNPDNFTLMINNSPNGATVIAESNLTDGLVLEYSLDGETWQESNVFNGLANGEYSLFVRDQLGCSFVKDFNIPETGIYLPFFYISKSNSLRFANRITFGDSENYKNDENTLSCEVDVPVRYQEVQRFQSADRITTQFKSNYKQNIATAFYKDETGTDVEIDLPVEQKTNNIGLKDRRDAIRYDLGGGRMGIYFTSGNTYDFDSGAITGTYSLEGLLPEWAGAGNYIQIGLAWFLIEELSYDENLGADVIIVSGTYSGVPESAIVGSIYNRFNYEVYEFTIDMVDYLDRYFRVRLVNSDPNFATITHLTEKIWCRVKHERVLEIKYRNTTNTDIYYSTGISGLLRIPYYLIKGKTDQESETNKTDTTAILQSADLYEVDDFVFEPLTKELWRKVQQALSHEIVSLDGVGYVKNGDFSTEGPLEESNLYVLTATMIKTGNVYNSDSSTGLEFTGSEIEVPGLIETESGFVRY